jgi:hypothetical protein
MSRMLPLEEAMLFWRLHVTFLYSVNQHFAIAPNVRSLEEFADLPLDVRMQVRDAFVKAPELVEPFVKENPAGLSDDELGIVFSWRNCVAGRFIVFRYLKAHTIFLSEAVPPTAYGVHALGKPLEEVVGPHLPVYVEAALLPFRDKIVFDGLIRRFNIVFGGGLKRRFNENYKAAKERMGGVVTSLPAIPRPAKEKKPRRKTSGGPRRTAAAEVRPVLKLIVGMTDQFCRENLNDEYAALCRKLAEKLSRKRPSPLFRGNPRTWAAGIVRTIGWANFLHDPAQTPHLRLLDIDDWFGIAESTGAAKLKEIRTQCKIRQSDHHWMLPSQLDDHPLIWIIEVNGWPMDVRQAPREIQEAAYRKGLIPYVPADQV